MTAANVTLCPNVPCVAFLQADSSCPAGSAAVQTSLAVAVAIASAWLGCWTRKSSPLVACVEQGPALAHSSGILLAGTGAAAEPSAPPAASSVCLWCPAV